MTGDGTSNLSTFWNSAFYLLTVLAIWSFIVFGLLPKFLFATTVYYAMPPHLDKENKKTIQACASYAKCTKEEREEEETEQKLQIAGKFQSGLLHVKSAKVAHQDTIEESEPAPVEQLQASQFAQTPATPDPLPPIRTRSQIS